MKKLPYGNCNFSDIKRRNFAYVDKTHFVELLENENNSYQIMLRPRRFGKSLFLSVLENYYDIKQKDKFGELFGDCYIGKNPTPEQGSYAVLRFDFSGIDYVNPEMFRAAYLAEVELGIKKFLAKYSQVFSNATGGDMMAREPNPGFNSLYSAYEAAENAGIPIFVLIDEYDHFANKLLAMGKAYKEEVSKSGIVRTFFEILKKGASTVVRRIFITGVSPMMVNDLTSGFNMASDFSLDRMYNEMFGFTGAEVEWLAKETGVDRSLISIDIEHYYNGYRFNFEADEKVYNSQMVLYLFDQVKRHGRQPTEIVDPNLRTGYERMQRLTESEDNRRSLLNIIRDGRTAGEVYRAFSVDDLSKERYFISLLFYMGMLTYDTDYTEGFYLKIPNYSVRTLYWEYLVEYISREMGERAIDTTELSQVINEMAFKGNVEPYVSFFTENFFKRLSNRDLRSFDEKYVKVMMLSSLCLSSLYSPVSEAETINGYTDIYLAKRKSTYEVKYEYIFEVKYIKKGNATENEIEKEFCDAMAQIEKYKKDVRFAGRDDIKYYALVFIGKDRCMTRKG